MYITTTGHAALHDEPPASHHVTRSLIHRRPDDNTLRIDSRNNYGLTLLQTISANSAGIKSTKAPWSFWH